MSVLQLFVKDRQHNKQQKRLVMKREAHKFELSLEYFELHSVPSTTLLFKVNFTEIACSFEQLLWEAVCIQLQTRHIRREFKSYNQRDMKGIE